MRRLKVEDGDDNGRMGDELGTYPDRPGEPDCIYYLRTGSCGYGSNCRFNHPSTNAGQVKIVTKNFILLYILCVFYADLSVFRLFLFVDVYDG